MTFTFAGLTDPIPSYDGGVLQPVASADWFSSCVVQYAMVLFQKTIFGSVHKYHTLKLDKLSSKFVCTSVMKVLTFPHI